MKRSIAAWSAAATLLALPFVTAPALAEAPMAKAQAPGYYRHMVGDIEVTALLDGTAKLPVMNLLKNAPPEQILAALKRGFLKELVETSVNGYLVNTGSKLVLIDAGTGGSFGYTAQFLDNLRAAGYKPEQIDEVYITHMHGDHVGGVLANKVRAFPNATLRLDKREADYWLSEEAMNRAPEQMRAFFKTAMAAVAPYNTANRFKTFGGATELVPGVFSMPTYGHTPGHTIYRIESKGQTLVLWGDLMHVASVQFDNPGVVISFDTDNNAAAAERAKAYAEAAAKGWLVGSAHISFPGLGNLRANADGKSYTWVPLNYSLLK
jgi:glyoxylase-like metal-dependent hydrolase (beta-lactamase superfamily II)